MSIHCYLLWNAGTVGVELLTGFDRIEEIGERLSCGSQTLSKYRGYDEVYKCYINVVPNVSSGSSSILGNISPIISTSYQSPPENV